jgi:hypothetical protein
MIDSVVVFDGTSYFVDSLDYILQDGEDIVFRGSFQKASDKCDALNDSCFDKPRTAF